MAKREKQNSDRRKDETRNGSHGSGKNGEDREDQVTNIPLRGTAGKPYDPDEPRGGGRPYGCGKGKPRGGGLPYPPRPGIEAPEKWDTVPHVVQNLNFDHGE